mgnify:CR=1 FL=1
MTGQVRRSCGVENLNLRLGKTRLRWFGHVRLRDENSILRRAMELEEVKGRRPVGKPKKTWNKVVKVVD